MLLYVILATAWNILGGYTGYVNFGSAAFFAIGAYTTVALYYAFKLPLLVTSRREPPSPDSPGSAGLPDAAAARACSSRSPRSRWRWCFSPSS